MANKIIRRIIISFIIGAVLGNVIAYLSTGFQMVIAPELKDSVGTVAGIIIQSVLSGFIGIGGIGGMALYDIESWGITKATIVHYISVMTAFVISATICKWGTFGQILILCLIETIIFFMIWLFMCLVWKRSIRDLNENLEKYRQENINKS